MTLVEQLAEKNEIKTIILQGMKDNASAGSLLSYTANNTKVTYEGATKAYSLISKLNAEIVTLEASIEKLNSIGVSK